MFGMLKGHGHGGRKRANRHLDRHAHRGGGHHRKGGHFHSGHQAHGGCCNHNGAHWTQLQIDDNGNYDESLPFFQLFSRESNAIDNHRAVDAMTCHLCKNHCPLSDPGCDKGRLYALSLTTKEEG